MLGGSVAYINVHYVANRCLQPIEPSGIAGHQVFAGQALLSVVIPIAPGVLVGLIAPVSDPQFIDPLLAYVSVCVLHVRIKIGEFFLIVCRCISKSAAGAEIFGVEQTSGSGKEPCSLIHFLRR